MSKTEFDVDTSVLNELDFTITCELRIGPNEVRCTEEAKYNANLHHRQAGCGTFNRTICEKHLHTFLNFDIMLKTSVCAVCCKNNPAITNIIRL